MPEFQSDRKRIAKNTMFLYIRMLLVMLIAFYTSRVILQALGASDFGVYNVVGGIITMMAFIVGPLNSTTMRFLTYALGQNDLKKLRETFACTLNIHIGVGLLTILIGETIGLWFFYNKLVIPDERMMVAFWVYQFSIITAFFEFTQIPYSATITSHENMSVYAYVGLYEAFSRLAIAIGITYVTWDKLWMYAFLMMLNKIAVLLFYRYYTSKRYEECNFRFFWDKVMYKRIISYAGWNIFGGLAVVSQGQGVNILLNMFFGPIVNAARAIVIQIQSAVTMFVTNFLTAVRPQVIKNCANKQYDEMYRLTFDTTKYSYFLMLLLIVPICSEIDGILRLWLGDAVPEHTSMFARLVLVTALFNTVDQSLLMVFHAYGRVKFGNIVGGTFMILTLPICYVIFKMGGIPEYAFVVILIINITGLIFDFLLIRHYIYFSIGHFVRNVLAPVIGVTIFAIMVPLTLNNLLESSYSRMVINVMLSEVVTMFVIWLIGLRQHERQMIFVLVKKKFSKG